MVNPFKFKLIEVEMTKYLLQFLLLIIPFCIFSSRLTYAQIQSGYFVAPTNQLISDNQELLENKIRASVAKVGAITGDGYVPVVTILKYNEAEVFEIQGMRSMFKSVGDVTILVAMESDEKPIVLGTMSFSIEGIGTTKQLAQVNAIRKINIPEKDLKALFEKVELAYKKSMQSICKNMLQSAKQLLLQKNFQGSMDAILAVTPDCANYSDAQLVQKEIIERYSEASVRQAQQAFVSGKYAEASLYASYVEKGTKAYAQAQDILSKAGKKIDAKQRKEEERIEKKERKEYELERLVISANRDIARANIRSNERIEIKSAQLRSEAESRYNALWTRIITR
jgi:hypothetical protein